MARSKESIRQNKAMQAILRGETPEKKIIIAVEDKKEVKKSIERREKDYKKIAMSIWNFAEVGREIGRAHV